MHQPSPALWFISTHLQQPIFFTCLGSVMSVDCKLQIVLFNSKHLWYCPKMEWDGKYPHENGWLIGRKILIRFVSALLVWDLKLIEFQTWMDKLLPLSLQRPVLQRFTSPENWCGTCILYNIYTVQSTEIYIYIHSRHFYVHLFASEMLISGSK